MLRSFSLAIALLTVAGSAAAQQSTGSVSGQAGDATSAQTADNSSDPTPLVDFILRPTEDATTDQSEDDIWNWNNEPGPSMLETPIGSPLLGPTGDETIGPPLAGPTPEPPETRVSRVRRHDVSDPFAQTGIRLGAFVIRPSIEIGVSATDNGAGTVRKTNAVGLAVAPEINIRSENDRYQFEADARGEAVYYRDEAFNTRTIDAEAKLRYALTSHTAVNAAAGYSQFLEGFSDPDTPNGSSERPAVDNLTASLGVEQSMGRVTASVTGFADRSIYEDVPLVGGGTASRKELDNTEFGVRVRAGYATSASVRPFVEAAVARREFDQHRDDSGFARSSVWGELLGGIVVDRGDKLSGEISLGYRREDLEDARLEDLNVFVANAAVLWSPHRLTDVKLDFTTGVQPTSMPGASASILYSATLTLGHDLTPRIRAETSGGFSYERRVGDTFHDLTFTGTASLSYAFNRTASIEARYEYDRTDQNTPGGHYDLNIVGIRLRLQR